ncbi:zinc-ribbon domain-containing protein [Shimia sp. SDUM112013]|uniref:zinc-ribbon domain-containing protein n=1 Tax=Shimia sp. SDUM112013 TaxID=3136160 RepID=UPI0032EAF820
MRLSCPNCGAQYEVPDDVIPQAGRDVQCSNCGHTWFQPPPEVDTALTEDLGGALPDEGWSPEDPDEADHPDTEIAPEVPGSDDEEEVQPPSIGFSGSVTDISEDAEEDRAAPEDDTIDTAWTDQDALPDPEDGAPETLERFEEEDDENIPDDLELDAAIGQAIAMSEEDTPTDTAPETADDQDEDRDLDETEAADQEDVDVAPEPGLVDDDLDIPEEDIPEPRRKTLDPAVTEILRQEAEHEAQVRAREREQGIETQPDLGLNAPDTAPPMDDNARRAQEARARMRRIRGLSAEENPDPVEPAPDPTVDLHTSRRDLLPDIEEINSSLRASDRHDYRDSEEPGAYAERKRRSGFRLGFSLMLLLAVAGILVYLYNQQITASVPQAAPYVESYMDGVNDARVWLDTRITEMMLALQSNSSPDGN